MAKQRLIYIELKSGHGDNGPAWISNVTFSRSGETIYFDGKALKRVHGGAIAGNFRDLESADEYWVSGVKKTGTNRHWAGSGKIQIDVNSVSDFLHHIGQREVDCTEFEICADIQPTDPKDFYEMENDSYSLVEQGQHLTEACREARGQARRLGATRGRK